MNRQAIYIFLLSFLLLSLVIPQVILAAECQTDDDCNTGYACQQGQCVRARALELVYPKIPGVATPKYVSTSLPDYINYIFRFSVILIGLLIFGALVWSGANYLLSFGNPSKLSDAKQGIWAALLGGMILLGSYLIFNTINPQLLILEPPEIGLLKAYIVPGVYLCNYKLENIGDILTRYTTDIPVEQGEARENALKTREEAAGELKEKMGKAGDKNNCFLANYSGVLNNLNTKNVFTLFIIPSEKYNSGTGKYSFDEGYDYGVVFHENDKFGGRCEILPEIQDTAIYHQVSNFHPKLSFAAGSITVFKKPMVEPPENAEGVTLYEGMAFNEIGKAEYVGACGGVSECAIRVWFLGYWKVYTACSKQCGPTQVPVPECHTFSTSYCNCAENSVCKQGSATPPKNYVSFQKKILSSLFSAFSTLAAVEPNLNSSPSSAPVGERVEVDFISDDDLDSWGLYHNTRSITIREKGSFIAVLKGAENNCEVRKTDDANLLDDPIGRCGQCSILWLLSPAKWLGVTECFPCIESMYVIKGQKL